MNMQPNGLTVSCSADLFCPPASKAALNSSASFLNIIYAAALFVLGAAVIYFHGLSGAVICVSALLSLLGFLFRKPRFSAIRNACLFSSAVLSALCGIVGILLENGVLSVSLPDNSAFLKAPPLSLAVGITIFAIGETVYAMSCKSLKRIADKNFPHTSALLLQSVVSLLCTLLLAAQAVIGRITEIPPTARYLPSDTADGALLLGFFAVSALSSAFILSAYLRTRRIKNAFFKA